MRARLASRAAVVFLLLIIGPLSLARPVSAEPADPCAGAVADAERSEGIPSGLLAAIASVESGRWDRQRQRRMAWPWTVNAGGQGAYYADRSAAIAAVNAAHEQGIRLVDVGCMQVNLHFHGAAFASLDQAFDPVLNARYAARFLRSLYAETGSWQDATMRYHSATPAFGEPYRDRVMALWRDRADEAPVTVTADDDQSQRRRPGLAAVDVERTRAIGLWRADGALTFVNRGPAIGNKGNRSIASGRARVPPVLAADGMRGTFRARDAEAQIAFAQKREQVIRQWRQTRGGRLAADRSRASE